MAYLSQEDIGAIGLKAVGHSTLISDKAVFYYPEKISIGSHARVDDFCMLSGNICIHNYVHLSAKSNLFASAYAIIDMGDYSSLSYQSTVFTATDDYIGPYFANAVMPAEYRNVTERDVIIGRFCTVGAASVIMPGVTLGEGSTIGAASLVTRNTEPWMCYIGSPARPYKKRDEAGVKRLEEEFLRKYGRQG